MKFYLLIFITCCMAFVPSKKPTRIVFFGDSITQAAVKPNGYITKLDSLTRNSTDSLQLMGAGISGNKITDLFLRLDADVLSKNPDIVVIYIGINDIWHKKTFGTGTDLGLFEKYYTAIVDRLRQQKIKVIICTPTVIGERYNNTNEQDGDLNLYSESIRNLASRLDLQVCDLRSAFMKYLSVNNKANAEKGMLTTDRVHLSDAGNLLVAQEMWKVILPLIHH